MKTGVAAIALGVTEQRVRQLVVEGKLPGSFRLGRKVWHVPAEAVFARRQAQAAEARAAMTPTTEEDAS